MADKSGKKISLLGLPGLYQNWLIGALDPSSYREAHDPTKSDSLANFSTQSDHIAWLRKNETDDKSLECYDTVINIYVKPDNFVWYLYNFLEKTDGVGIMVDNMASDLFEKAPGTIAFDHMLKHFVISYGIDQTTARSIIENSLIEYFYFILVQDHSLFRVKTHRQMSKAINLEYEDFAKADRLLAKLGHLPILDRRHFLNEYDQLIARNKRYLAMKARFPRKIKDDNLDILETAYTGALIHRHTNHSLDWFNPELRRSNVTKYRDYIIEWHMAL